MDPAAVDVVIFAEGRPGMVVLDVDGTLHVAPGTDPLAHEPISSAVRAAVRAAIRSGVPI
jgi:hypothetical protein